MAVAIKLPNGNKYVRDIVSIGEWVEVYDHKGAYEGIVFYAADLRLASIKSKYVLIRLSPSEFHDLRLKCVRGSLNHVEIPLDVEPYDKDPFA